MIKVISIITLFQGIATLFMAEPRVAILRLLLIGVGFLLVYLGYRHILDPLVIIPMGFAMIMVNAGVMVMMEGELGTLFISPLATTTGEVVDALQIYFLQPFFSLTFANGLIACLVFMGIGATLDLDFFLAKPFLSMALAIPAELGTILALPIGVACGLPLAEAASVASIGGADGPMVLYTSLMLARDMFVPITIIAYVYLSVCYILYPLMIKKIVPRRLQGIEMDPKDIPRVSSTEKFAFAIIGCFVLCLLFPVAAPLFACLFFGIVCKEAKIRRFTVFLDDVVLTGSTMILGFVLGAVLSADVVLDPRVFLILVIGLLALILSGLGGLAGGLIAYKLSKGKINPLIGVAGVSCLPTTVKIVQKCAQEANPRCIIMPHATGPCIAGIITTAIICGYYVTMLF